MMTSHRKHRIRINRRTELLLKRRLMGLLENQMWDQMPAVGREFGSPDFDRLMEEDFRQRGGVFSAEMAAAFNKRRAALLKSEPVVPPISAAPRLDDLLADFEGGAEFEAPEDPPLQPRMPL